MQELKKYAYVTLLSDDLYFYYLLAMYYSGKATKSEYEFLCLVTENVSPLILELLLKTDIPFKKIETADVYDAVKKLDGFTAVPVFVNAISKFKIFTLTQYDKCVYLDADMGIMKNVDDLFNYEPFSAVEDIHTTTYENKYLYHNGMTMFNSGMFVFEPSVEFYNKVISGLATMPQLAMSDGSSKHGHDQNILGGYNQDGMSRPELHLPVTYNGLIDAREPIYNPYQVHDIKIKHFVGEKRFFPVGKETQVSAIVYKDWLEYLLLINKIIDSLQLPIRKIDLTKVIPILHNYQ